MLGGCLGVAAATVVLTVLALTIVHLPAWLQGRERPCSSGGGVSSGGDGSSGAQASAPRPGADSDQRRILSESCQSSSSPSDSPIPAASGTGTGVEYV